MSFSINREALFIPNADYLEGTVTLTKRISAIPLVPCEEDRPKLGTLCQLEPGAVVELCGTGYNERTSKVRIGRDCFFVFTEDLK
jgi:hypothetical protein